MCDVCVFIRYYAICQPLRARHVHTTTRAVALVAIIWAASLLLVSPQLFVQRLEPMLALQLEQEPPIRIAEVSRKPLLLSVITYRTQVVRLAVTKVIWQALWPLVRRAVHRQFANNPRS